MAITFDDAVGIILFDISIVIMRIILRGGPLHVSEMILAPLREIGLSTLIRATTGFLMIFMTRWFCSKSEQLLLAIMIVLAIVIVFEIVGPIGTKYELFGSREVASEFLKPSDKTATPS